jgi:hypothetical protein
MGGELALRGCCDLALYWHHDLEEYKEIYGPLNSVHSSQTFAGTQRTLPCFRGPREMILAIYWVTECLYDRAGCRRRSRIYTT